MEKISSRVCVVGAGPAGSVAALFLAREGIDCLLIDKESFPRDKICGDGVSGKVLSVLNELDPELIKELGKRDFVTPSWGVRFYSPNLSNVFLRFEHNGLPHPPGFICKRKDLDNFLIKKIRSESHIRLIEGTGIDKAEKTGEGIDLFDKEGKYHISTKLLIIATGTDDLISHSLGIDIPGRDLQGLGIRCYYENIQGFEDNHAIEIHFLKEVLPWYLWIFPFKDNSANVGLALPMEMVRKKGKSLSELLIELIDTYPHLKDRFRDARLVSRAEACRLPIYTTEFHLSGDHFMLAGDVARLVDPFTGEGMGNAMVSGKVAAEVAIQCCRADHYDHSHTSRYEKRIYHKLNKELSLGIKLQKLARNPYLINLVIEKADKKPKVRKMLTDMLYSINTMGKMSRPVFYLKLMLKI